MRIGIAGLGLIGGSLALALRDRHDIVGFDVDPETRRAAVDARITVRDRLEGLLPADAVIVATPLASVLPTLTELAPIAGTCVLLDVSSVRAPVDAFARDQQSGARIVGMHPMAGRSARGFASASASLLADHPFLVVPTASSDADAMQVAGAIARDAGGVVTVCSATEHDRVAAVVSALPLLLASALTIVADDATRGRLADVAGTGLRDATRLALTPDDLATQLVTANAAQVVVALARLRDTLDELEHAVAARDTTAIAAILDRARVVRSELH